MDTRGLSLSPQSFTGDEWESQTIFREHDKNGGLYHQK